MRFQSHDQNRFLTKTLTDLTFCNMDLAAIRPKKAQKIWFSIVWLTISTAFYTFYEG